MDGLFRHVDTLPQTEHPQDLCLQLFQRIEEANRYLRVAGATLPEYGDEMRDSPAPNSETLLAWTRLFLGRAYLAIREHNSATSHLQWALDFERRKPSVLDVGEEIRIPAKLANIELVKIALLQRDVQTATRLFGTIGRPRFLTRQQHNEVEQLRQQIRALGGNVSPSRGANVGPQQSGLPGQMPQTNQPNQAGFSNQQLRQQLTMLEKLLENPDLNEQTKKFLEQRVDQIKRQLGDK